MKPKCFTTAYFFRNNALWWQDLIHVTSHTSLNFHTHDFAEIFWVEHGRGTHLINGLRQELQPGSLVLIRPFTDCHCFTVPRGAKRLRVFTLMLRSETVDFFRRNYFPKSTTFFWTTDRRPFATRFQGNNFEWLTTWDRLLWKPADRLLLDRFLLELFSRLLVNEKSATPPAPTWLQQALVALRQPQHFRGGTPALARLAGRTPQRVNQVLHQFYGQTATNVVNLARMEYAAQELVTTEKKIVDICEECGFQNLSHFYWLFAAHHKTTPRLYRENHRTLG
ncbi:MAG: HTH-type transcriptional regulator ChbR [Verrucomicrobiae bacterium]|nr:HTH-type transcriptional regulator ChbR [Verrucomicrobiae bacterium]